MVEAAIRKMKRAEQDYKSLLVWYKETKCEVEKPNEELIDAYSKIVVFESFECLFLFDQSLLVFVSKIQKHIKSRKSKKFDRHYCVLSHACFALYLHTNGFVHLQA